MRYRETVVGQGDGGGKHLGQRQRPVLGMNVQPRVEQAGHRNAQDAFHGDPVTVPLQRRCVGRGPGPVGQPQGVVLRPVGHDEPVAADARHQRLDDVENRRRGDGGVKSVAALLQNGYARLGRQGMAGADHAVASHDHRTVGRVADAVG